MKEPPAIDAASFNKETSEKKVQDLGEGTPTGIPQDGNFEVVEEEEKEADEQSLSEVAIQDSLGEFD
jgi:hypothetical protein